MPHDTREAASGGEDDAVFKAAWDLLLACEDDMETHDPADRDDEPVGGSRDAPTRVQFGHMRRLRKALETVPASLPAGTGSDEEGMVLGASPSGSGSRPSDQAPSGLAPAGVDPSRGWQPIETAPKGKETVLLIGSYPGCHGWSDPYAGWWDGRGWVRWPHLFGPAFWAPITVPHAVTPDPRQPEDTSKGSDRA